MRKNEYDKPYTNTMEVRNIGRKQHMKEIRRDTDYGDRTIKVVLQFPDDPQDAEMIQDEVMAILMMELQEQMKNML